jgi:hypothetical protein
MAYQTSTRPDLPGVDCGRVLRAAPLLLGFIASWSCSFDPLKAAPKKPGTFDDLEQSAEVNGIQVSPVVIHPGAQVALRDPFVPAEGERALLYYWDACAGAISQAVPHSREAIWVAPPEPGYYDVSVNINNAVRTAPSRTLRLCVAAQGERVCAAPPSPPPQLRSIGATPNSLLCAAFCETTVESLVDAPGPASTLTYRWVARRGLLVGRGASVKWELPAPGCCPETFTAALTACDERHAAATGIASVVTTPQ